MGANGRFFLCGSFAADYDRYDVKNGMLFLHLEQQEGEYYILADEMLVCKLRLVGEHFAAYIDREARFVSLYLLALDKDGKNDITYMYKGNWRNNFPNGQGTVIYKKYKNDKLSYYTKTTGKYSNGYEDSDMTIVKKKSSNKTELKMSYKAIYGEPVILLEDGEPVKASDGTYVIGYYCDENGSKKEIASVKGKNGVADKVYWRVQGLPYSR